MDAGKKTVGAGVAEPRPEKCSQWPPWLHKGLSMVQVG